MTYRSICQYIDSARKYHRTVQFVFLAALVSLFSLFPVAAASAATEQSASVKAAPTAPRDTPGVTAPVPGKAQSQSFAIAAAWTASLTASSTNLWPTQYSTLTATTNQDVGPTPYYLSIYNVTTGSYIKICGTGTTCSVSVTRPTASTHSFRAYVSSYPTVNPPANQQAVSGTVSVTWRGVSVSLAASPTTLGVNGTSTLTATASADVGPSPFYIQIYNATTGTRLKACGFGTVCSVGTSKAFATTNRFVAYVSNLTTAYPPTGIQATSNPSYITWTNSNYRISLSSVSTGLFQRQLTAYANQNVGPTPYYIQIFNLNTGARIAICGTGTSCSVTVSTGFSKVNYIAFISSSSTAVPPLNTQANSNVLSIGTPIIIGPTANQLEQ